MMATKRALVVDDSRSARIALKKLLEEHELDVVLAESGEDALEFLKKDNVDVVFMDHTMPGMDGLEAVAAIKANPRTATIPVMMYTTKEGEVYVGQARALGAVGVLPKNVQPHQVFEMLRNLGLVQERRSVERPVGREPASLADVVDEVDRELEEQALGMSVQTLVTRILEDQHLTLRADILRSQKDFARQVAHEILKDQALAGPTVNDSAVVSEEETHERPSKRRGPVLAAIAVIAIVVSSFLAFQFKQQRDVAFDQLVTLEASRSATATANSRVEGLRDELAGARAQSRDMLGSALAGFEWAANIDNDAGMYDPAFTAEIAERIRALLPHVRELGFTGEIVLTSHLGRFCLIVDDVGNYQLASDDLPMLSCDYVGHVLEDSNYVGDRVSVEFAQLMREQSGTDPEIRLAALEAAGSEILQRYPGTSATAGDWNAAARANNRVEVRFEQNATSARN